MQLIVFSLQFSCSQNYDDQQILDFNNGNIQNFISQNGTLTIPCGITQIDQQIYNYNKKQDIIEILMPDTVTQLLGQYQINDTDNTITYQGAFSGCINLKEVKFSQNLTIIGQSAFEDCNSLQNIEIPEKINEIKTGAFLNCKNLQKIKLPQNLQILQKNSFQNCENLQEIVFSLQMSEIQENTFFNCKSLNLLNIPNNILYIRRDAFNGCSDLQCVHIENQKCQVDKNAFSQTNYQNEVEISNFHQNLCFQQNNEEEESDSQGGNDNDQQDEEEENCAFMMEYKSGKCQLKQTIITYGGISIGCLLFIIIAIIIIVNCVKKYRQSKENYQYIDDTIVRHRIQPRYNEDSEETIEDYQPQVSQLNSTQCQQQMQKPKYIQPQRYNPDMQQSQFRQGLIMSQNPQPYYQQFQQYPQQYQYR